MSFGTSTRLPDPPPKPLGIDATRTSTNQQVRPLPYAAGKRLIALTWISDVWNVRAEPIRQRVGKNKQTVGYNYICSFAGIAGHGPFDKLFEIRFDGEIVWEGELSRVDDSEDITIETRGSATLYWGTETQTADADLVAGSGQDHPPYRGQCYLVFKDIHLGQNRTAVPNIEILAQRLPDPSWFTASPNVSEDASLVACVAEWLQNHRFGLGLPDARLDLTSFNAVAAALETEDIGVSPYVDRRQSARQLLIEAFEYVDAYLAIGPDGKIGLALVRPASAPSLEFDESALIGEPAIDVHGWHETKNEIVVEYVNRDRDYQEDASNWRDMGNFQITGEPLTEKLSRTWATRTEVANKIAAAFGRVSGIPRQSGRFSIRKSKLGALVPGGRFLFSWTQLGLSNLVCRCLALRWNSPADPVVEVTWEVDRGELNTDDYLPEIDDPPETPIFDPAENEFEEILEAPAGLPLEGLAGERLIVLAARGNLLTTGLNIWHRLPSTTYQFEAAAQLFQVHGELDEDYTAGTTVIDSLVGLLITIDSLDTEFENRALEDALTNDVLLLVGDEILAPFDAQLVAPNQWRVYAIRGRYDTERLAHSTGAEVWFLERALGTYHPAHPEEETQTYKLQPYSINREVTLGDVNALDVTTNHRGLRPLRPLNLAEDGDKVAPTYSTGQSLALSWDQTMEVRPFMWSLWGGGITANLPKTVLEFRTVGDVLRRTVTLDPGENTYTYDNAELQADFGGEETVVVHAYQQRDSFRSLLRSELTVLFV